MHDNDSPSESRRCTENYERVIFREKSLKKREKCKWFLAFSSFMLMIALSFAIYVHHHDVTLSPFKWALMQMGMFLLFFNLGIAVAFVNGKFQHQD